MFKWFRKSPPAPPAPAQTLEPEPEPPQPRFHEIAGPEAVAALAEGRFQLLDVRTQPEYQNRRLPGSTNIPLHGVPERVEGFDPEKETLVICEHGMRSLEAIGRLIYDGWDAEKLWNLSGGLASYSGDTESG